MSQPGDEMETKLNERAKLEQAVRVNRLLLGVLVVVLIGAAGFVGWLMGHDERSVPVSTAVAGHQAHANCQTELPPRGQALLRGIRCGHNTPMVDAHCDEGHAMKRFVLELLQQGVSDEEIKAGLLRRYGEKGLVGREW